MRRLKKVREGNARVTAALSSLQASVLGLVLSRRNCTWRLRALAAVHKFTLVVAAGIRRSQCAEAHG